MDIPNPAIAPHEAEALRTLLTTPQHLDDDGVKAFAQNPALRALLTPEQELVLWGAVARLCEDHAHMVYDMNYDGSF